MKRGLSRVDVQVCVIVAVVVACSFLCVYAFNYQVTYGDMLSSLKERSDSIHEYVEDSLDKATFSGIDSAEDMDDPSYRTMKKAFEAVKEATGVRYLYTAKRTDEGSFVYVVDGLSSKSDDFRAPGDLIEDEIVPDMERALDNEVVYPSDIKDTGWGYVFVTYYPIHEDGEVIGVIGIEFDAQHQYDAFETVRIGTPVIAALFCLLAIVVAFFVFRRVSNPWYRDMANTDYLTGLKNRNAFEVDVANWERAEARACGGIVSVDLDGLKDLNDTFGHAAGDEAIKRAAAVVAGACAGEGMVYRVGGDEFVACFFDLDDERAAAFARRVHEACAAEQVEGRALSLSVGWALRAPGEGMEDLLRRADASMYEEKKRSRAARG
ncbi:diguanylate cyclase [Eggerthella sinensis]|uniref:diguanylate cyclase n=1 Tax=Eggerthella sinensis TaxID=242230 RepID=UPI001D06A206|nr:diguanylate cyclase [Eggerthella sinensis]MCB7037102.1 diguanylate cyclase [Eggerthella sinensis]